jgi:hypothetical protein
MSTTSPMWFDSARMITVASGVRFGCEDSSRESVSAIVRSSVGSFSAFSDFPETAFVRRQGATQPGGWVDGKLAFLRCMSQTIGLLYCRGMLNALKRLTTSPRLSRICARRLS